jgi:glycosyltransferase involved in cell wall biosynthesis
MHRIVFDAIKTSNMNSGLGRFCNSLGNELSNRNNGFEYDFIVKDINLNLDFLPQRKLAFSEKFFGIKSANILHQTHQDSILKSSNKSTKIILTIHDLNFLEKDYSEAKKNKKLESVQKKINRADVIVFISEYTKSIVNKHLLLGNKKQFIIYNGNTLNTSCEEKSINLIPTNSNFFFTLGMIQEKKNFHVLVPVLKKFIDYYLVIAGDTENSYTKKITSLAKDLGVENRLILPGKISDSEKLWLYKNCKAFLFPSIAEGFGLPIIEALSLGVKVVASNKCSLPEIGKNYIHYFNTFEPDKIGNDLFEIILKSEMFSEQEKIKYAQTYSWENAANEYIKIYQSLIKKTYTTK